MFESFYPDHTCGSTYEIDYGKLYSEGIRGIIFDIDNTLVEHGAHADERAKKFFGMLHEMGFSVLLLSNNREERVSSFKDEVIYCDYIFKAGKPGKRGYLKALEMLGTKKDNTIFIGDQLFTDIWGAKKTGIRTILVKPIDKKEEIQIILKRRLETVVLFFYKRRRKDGDIWTYR